MKGFWSRNELKWLDENKELMEKSGGILTSEIYGILEESLDMLAPKLLFGLAYLSEKENGFRVEISHRPGTTSYSIGLFAKEKYMEPMVGLSTEILDWSENIRPGKNYDKVFEKRLVDQLLGLVYTECGNSDLVRKVITDCVNSGISYRGFKP